MFNVVSSSDHLVGEELTISPLVDLISFTGSTATGKRIFEKGGATMKRLFLELGGKSADIVLDDADLESKMAMASHGLRARRPGVRHAHAACSSSVRSTTRRSRSRRPGFQNFPYGDPTDAGNLMGPQVSAKQRDARARVHREGQGRKARASSPAADAPSSSRRAGSCSPRCSPTSTNDMTIAREEIFGPVLIVIPFDDDDDAVRIANDNQYGLGGYVTGLRRAGAWRSPGGCGPASSA